MLSKHSSGFATATIFLILVTITFALASQLKRENASFKNLPNIVGHRHQLEFKKEIKEKFLNPKESHQKNEIGNNFNLIKLPSQGLFNLTQLIDGDVSQNFSYNNNLVIPASKVITGCTNGLANLEDIKFILPSFLTKLKSVPILAFQPFSKLSNQILLELSRCIRISPKLSKTNLTLSPPHVLSLILNIDASKAAYTSDNLRNGKINNFNELISFLKQNNYDYRKGLKWYDFNFGGQQSSRSVAIEKDGNIFYMADLFVLGTGKEVITWNDLQWLPGS